MATIRQGIFKRCEARAGLALFCYNSIMEIIPLLLSFLIAYAGVSVLGFALYLLISRSRGTSPWDEVDVRHNSSYKFTQRFLPLINLVVWTASAWFYFFYVDTSYANAFGLGFMWLVGALLVDYAGFVLIKHPLSVDHKGFYVDQFPWIYFTYLAVFVSPFIIIVF